MINEFIKKIYWLLSTQFGIDLRRFFFSIRGAPRFLQDWFKFRTAYAGAMELRPCLYDWYEEGGSTKNEYFWQDLHIARKIAIASPKKHVDIGSRIDGFVAHVASFREIEVFDIRPITARIEGIVFKQADFMNPPPALAGYCDSLSCLHALEHFGLGRYGDAVDPNGDISGLKNMTGLLQAGGIFYLSVPIGVERVEFNAHRVFNPQKLVLMAGELGLKLQEFAWFETGKGLVQSFDLEFDMRTMSARRYALGIFIFRKK